MSKLSDNALRTAPFFATPPDMHTIGVTPALLASADSFAFEQDEAELRACIAELKSQMLVLSEMQEISIRNIL